MQCTVCKFKNSYHYICTLYEQYCPQLELHFSLSRITHTLYEYSTVCTHCVYTKSAFAIWNSEHTQDTRRRKKRLVVGGYKAKDEVKDHVCSCRIFRCTCGSRSKALAA
jgi:hypothetical protein